MTTTTNVCACCGQTIKATKARASAKSFKAWADFTPALMAARKAAVAALGERWHLVPGASVWARVPTAWVSCKVFARSSVTPRDIRMPAAKFWPAGALPIGAEYAEPTACVDSTPGIMARRAELRARHARYLADLREHGRAPSPLCAPLYPPRTIALGLAELAAIRRQFATAGQFLRYAA